MTKNETILEALVEYKENNWESHNDIWNDMVNDLIRDYKLKVLEEEYE